MDFSVSIMHINISYHTLIPETWKLQYSNLKNLIFLPGELQKETGYRGIDTPYPGV